MSSKLILLRHGKSAWNERNLFTGWVDVPLSATGVEEALQAGSIIQEFPVDYIFTSKLIRSIMTALLAMTKHSSKKTPYIIHEEAELKKQSAFDNPQEKASMIPLIANNALNERHYGDLQGKNKKETAEQYGEEQVKLWRRSYDVPPPAGESLEDTAKRTIPYFVETIIPLLDSGKNVLISAHGNSLRSIIMDIEKLSREGVLSLEVPTGQPIVYTRENQCFTKIALPNP
ncbi:2,3-bisphosphoglycerate-dependent phosphoglycerate mutase [Chlamydiifrater phoenicopteri]|uniref:2,3-bisphosphoglycerate-dependent phosphoglycerate mutase n=1 Tax=Chlamydiifrater phoenicopteri TaxID=2681469 RepID=UPI001BCC9CA0|nr:2,3-bisphosphoglycerate-dependent phosphoglycerate mutase [Chlamydiifrater phoenicopteri]